MTPKQRILGAIEGRQRDRLPVAPYFWGEEYVWKLMGKPVWQVSLGRRDTWKDIVRAVQARHDCDWVISLGGGSGFLEGKRVEERCKGVEMDIGAIRREVGPQQCLFGNFDSYLLLRGDRAAIAREVERQVRAAGRDGAFIMGAGSPICDATDADTVDFWLAVTRRKRPSTDFTDFTA